jgi:hypothetical protein
MSKRLIIVSVGDNHEKATGTILDGQFVVTFEQETAPFNQMTRTFFEKRTSRKRWTDAVGQKLAGDILTNISMPKYVIHTGDRVTEAKSTTMVILEGEDLQALKDQFIDKKDRDGDLVAPKATEQAEAPASKLTAPTTADELIVR